jgi:hypothetical protein
VGFGVFTELLLHDLNGHCVGLQVFVGILRSYTIAIAILVILAETEWELLFRFWGVSVLCFVQNPHTRNEAMCLSYFEAWVCLKLRCENHIFCIMMLIDDHLFFNILLLKNDKTWWEKSQGLILEIS